MEATQWRYEREHITDLTHLDEKLAERGNHGWELAAIVHGKDLKPMEEGNILTPEGWIMIFKQRAA
jgi:hypothetical protein